jgi:hemerythrin HHE cation binding domain subfamily protein
MWTVDDEIRDTLGELKRELTEKSKGVRALKNTGEDLDDEEEEYSRSKAEIAESILNSFFLKNYLAVRNRMEEMIYKEENILFPMCALQFQKEEWIQIYFDSKDYEACFSVENATWKEAEENGNTPEKWRAIEAAGESEREKSAKEASEEHSGDFHNAALPQGAGKMLEDLLRRVESLEGKSGHSGESPSASDGEIIMPGGHLKKNELIAMLNTLPVEITFVDKDNINRFFNEGPKVFKRPQMAIDREVFSCHPPKVEPMVRMIIGNFRDGKEDEVPIWMEKGGKPFLVRYMAVRDKEQNYVGTLEAVTDMTEVKEHFRQYFKSHPEEL